MTSKITKLALSLGLTLSLGFAFVPLGCGSPEEAVFTPVRPTRRSPDVPDSVQKQLTDCVRHASARFPPAEGNTHAILFNVRASRSGSVRAVEIKDSSLGGHEVEACFAGVLQGMTLPMQDMAMRLADPVSRHPAAPHGRALVGTPPLPVLVPVPALAPIAWTPVVITVFGFIIVVAIIVYVVSEASDITLDPPLAATAAPTATAVPIATAIPITRRYPTQTCDDEVLDALEAEKNNLCKGKYAADCSPDQRPKVLARIPCSAIKRSLEKRLICLSQRKLIQEKCFGGVPDAGHKIAIDQVQNGVNNCETLKLANCAKGHPMAGL